MAKKKPKKLQNIVPVLRFDLKEGKWLVYECSMRRMVASGLQKPGLKWGKDCLQVVFDMAMKGKK